MSGPWAGGGALAGAFTLVASAGPALAATSERRLIEIADASVLFLVFSVAGLVVLGYLYRRLLAAKEELAGSNERMEKLFESAPFPLLVTRLSDSTLIYANPVAVRMYDLGSPERVVGWKSAALYRNPENRAEILGLLERDGKVDNHEIEIVTPAGRILWVLYSARRIEYGGEPCILTSQTDITDRRRSEVELERFANTDTLTGVANRRAGLLILERAVKLAERDLTPLSICFVDVDDLKTVNDRHGHKVGDQLIVSVVEAIGRCLRQSDTLCRLGGDEFLLVLPGCDLRSAESLWERVESELEAVNRMPGKPYSASVSHGFAEYPLDAGPNVDEFISWADAEMYKRKAR